MGEIGMNLSNGVNPLDDTVHDPRDVPHWSESYAWWTWDDQNDVGIYGHFQRHPQDVMLWRGYCAVMIADQVYIHHSYGRQLPGKQGPGFESCHIRIEEPHKRWRFRVDAAGIQRSGAELFRSAITDGPAVPMTVDVALELRSPVWSAGHPSAEAEEIMAAHFEQKGWCTGTVKLGEKSYRIDCLGANDHSFGPRNTTKLINGSGFINCAFPSGRSLTAIVMSPEAHLGYLDFGDGKLLAATKVVLPDISWETGSRGRLHVEAGDVTADIAIEVSNRRVAMTMVPPNFEHVGLIDGDKTALLYTDKSCRVEWDGEQGSGSWEACRNNMST
jgi:hypothetical protein